MKIGFIGAGKVGMALGLYLLKYGFNITGYYSRSFSSAKEAALLTSSQAYKTLEDIPIDTDLIFITVNDDQIDIVDKDLAATTTINKRHIVAHTSGAHGSSLLKELKRVGCSTYSIHPLQSFAEPVRTVVQLESTVFTLEGDNNKLEIIKSIFNRTHNKYFVINEELKPLYHVGACIASNYLVTLMNFSFDYFEKAGINRKDIFTAIAPLIYGTLDNISNTGTVQALTGPLIRKDVKTIESHIQTLREYMPETLGFYKYLALETIHMVDGKRMDEVELLNNLLGKEDIIMNNKYTINSFADAKSKKEKIAMLTAYDYSMAKIIDEAGVDVILVGDSVGMVVQGYDSTLEVTVEDIIYHCKAVARGVKRAMIIGDMPFLSYHISTDEAIRNAGRIIKEGKAHAVKLEGGLDIVDKIKAIRSAQIPVMGHIGLTPQSVNIFGGFKVQGKQELEAKRIIEDAKAIEEAGVFAIVLEAIPEQLAKIITETINIPTIGIGAGAYCDGQVLVINDLLGMNSDFTPKFVKKYADLKSTMTDAVKDYIKEVKATRFPEKKHTFSISEDILEKLY